MNDYQNKKITSWTVQDTENYFEDILNTEEKEIIRVITSKDLNDEEDLALQSTIAQWYFQKDLKRTDNFLEDLLKKLKENTQYNDFLIQTYIPIGTDEMCFGLKFEAIERSGIIQVGVGSFQECILKGVNNYLTNNPTARSMIIIKAFDTKKEVYYQEGETKVKSYEKDVFHFVVENETLYGVDVEASKRIQEHDTVTQMYIGKEVGTTYIDTTNIVAEFEVDKFMQEIGIYLHNH